jgi:hypothetical protein
MHLHPLRPGSRFWVLDKRIGQYLIGVMRDGGNCRVEFWTKAWVDKISMIIPVLRSPNGSDRRHLVKAGVSGHCFAANGLAEPPTIRQWLGRRLRRKRYGASPLYSLRIDWMHEGGKMRWLWPTAAQRHRPRHQTAMCPHFCILLRSRDERPERPNRFDRSAHSSIRTSRMLHGELSH